MTQADKFIKWAESNGATVEVIQSIEESGGYSILEMKLPDHVGETFEVSVSEL